MLHLKAVPVSTLLRNDLEQLAVDQYVLVMVSGRYADSGPRNLASRYGKASGKVFHCYIDHNKPRGLPVERDYEAMRVLTVIRIS